MFKRTGYNFFASDLAQSNSTFQFFFGKTTKKLQFKGFSADQFASSIQEIS